MTLSDRSATGHEPDALERAIAARRGRGEPILDLSLRDPDHEPDARVVLLSTGPAAIVQCSACNLAPLLLVCDPGDDVLVPEPSRSRFAHAAQLAGVSLSPYPLRFDGRWELDAEALWDAIGERTRAIVASSPNDATGAFLTEGELEALDSLALPLIVDARLARHPLEASAIPSTAAVSALRLTIDIGRIAVSGPEGEVAAAVERLIAIEEALGSARSSLLPSPPRVASEEPRPDRMARASLHALRQALEGSEIEVPRVDAGWHAAVRLPPGETDEGWALGLLERGVLACPGSRLGFPEEAAWLVLGLLAEPEALRDAGVALRELERELSSRGARDSRSDRSS